MRYILTFLLIATVAWAQPGLPPGPKGPATTTTTSQPSSPVPFLVGTLTFVSSSRLTVKSEATPGSMDFKTDPTTFQPARLSSGDRVVVAYTGEKATAVLKCPQGSNPQELLKTVPKK